MLLQKQIDDSNYSSFYKQEEVNDIYKGVDKNLSPYAFTKAKNLELLENLKKWFNFKFEIIYFYNVYGPNQICKGKMATVIGIFENCFKTKKPLTVVRPGSNAGLNAELDAIAACIIGGASFFGGRGTVLGVFAGVMIMGILRNGLNLNDVSAFWQQVLIGSIIVIAVYVDVLRKDLGTRK